MRLRTPRAAGRVLAAMLLCVAAAGGDTGAAAAQEVGDGLPAVAAAETPSPIFTSTDGYLAATAALGTFALSPFDQYVADLTRNADTFRSSRLSAAIDGLAALGGPGTLVIAGGLYAVGRAGDHEGLARTGLRTAEAIAVAEVITYGLKGLTGRARPRRNAGDSHDFSLGRGLLAGDFRSFPSAHTSAAFAAATVLALEAGPEDGGLHALSASILYSAATLTAISRIYNHEHWVSDTVMGAAIGAWSGWKVIDYHSDRPDSRVDRWFLSATVVGGKVASVSLLPVPGR